MKFDVFKVQFDMLFTLVNFIILIYRYTTTTCSWVDSFPTTGGSDVADLGNYEIDSPVCTSEENPFKPPSPYLVLFHMLHKSLCFRYKCKTLINMFGFFNFIDNRDGVISIVMNFYWQIKSILLGYSYPTIPINDSLLTFSLIDHMPSDL